MSLHWAHRHQIDYQQVCTSQSLQDFHVQTPAVLYMYSFSSVYLPLQTSCKPPTRWHWVNHRYMLNSYTSMYKIPHSAYSSQFKLRSFKEMPRAFKITKRPGSIQRLQADRKNGKRKTKTDERTSYIIHMDDARLRIIIYIRSGFS